MVNVRFIGLICSLFVATAHADELAVFGPEFCTPYSAGTCINFHHEVIKDAKTWVGAYKYPKGRKAYEECVKKITGSDGEYAFCSMVFHREEQSNSKRIEMCQRSTRDKYLKTTSNNFAMNLYDAAWDCNK